MEISLLREKVEHALIDRRVLIIQYAATGSRRVQPHAIVRKPDGTEMLEAYQVGGHSEGGAEHGWKNFDLARITGLEVAEQTFEPRRDFQPISGEWGRLVAQVRHDAAASA